MSSTEKITDKIRKLLALSKSSNQHEAAAAAARAADLMATHQIAEARLDVSCDREPIGEQTLDGCGRRVRWKGVLAAGICKAFSCRSYWRSARHPDDPTVAIRVVGRPADVAATRYMYAYLVAEVERLANSAWRDRHSLARAQESARSWKNAFRAGAAVTISRRLQESRTATFEQAAAHNDAATAEALIRLQSDSAELDSYLETLGLRTMPRTTVSSASGLHCGAAAGNAVPLTSGPGLARPALQLTSGD